MEKLFDEYNIDKYVKLVCKSLGYEKPSEIQKVILKQLENNFLNKKENYLILSQAGSGKTFSYLLCFFNKFDPTLKKLQGIILLPTRELASQTVDYFEQINASNIEGVKINFELLVGGTAGFIGKTQKVKPLALNDNVQVIIGTLGKVYSTIYKALTLQKKRQNNKFQTNSSEFQLYFQNLKCVIIDEADKMRLQNKYCQFEKLLSILLQSNNYFPTILLTSASFNKDALEFYKRFVKEDIILLQIEKDSMTIVENDTKINSGDNLIQCSENYSNTTLLDNNNSFKTSILNNIKEYFHIFRPQVKVTYYEQKYEKLFFLLNSLNKNFKQCLIFYNQKGRGEELASDIRSSGYATTFIHGDLNQDQRSLIYKKIKNIQVKIILATDLLSRGIDLSTIDLVINFDCPFNSTEYFHRVGRTGRYNSYGVAVSFFQENEQKILDEIKLQDEIKKMKEIDQIDEEIVYVLNNDLQNVQVSNKISLEIKEKVKNIEGDEVNYVQNLEILKNQKSENFLKKKRRNEQYGKESLVSEWVDIEETLHDESNFKYFEKEASDNNCKFCLYCNLMKIFEIDNDNI